MGNKQATISHVLDYPISFQDPNPILPGSNPDELDNRSKIIVAFGKELYDIISSEESTGEEPWVALISPF